MRVPVASHPYQRLVWSVWDCILCFCVVSNFWTPFTGTWVKRWALELVKDFPPQRNVFTRQGIMSLESRRHSRAWKPREASGLPFGDIYLHTVVLDLSCWFPLWRTICVQANETHLLVFWDMCQGFFTFLLSRKIFDSKEANVSAVSGGDGGLWSLSYINSQVHNLVSLTCITNPSMCRMISGSFHVAREKNWVKREPMWLLLWGNLMLNFKKMSINIDIKRLRVGI